MKLATLAIACLLATPTAAQFARVWESGVWSVSVNPDTRTCSLWAEGGMVDFSITDSATEGTYIHFHDSEGLATGNFPTAGIEIDNRNR